MINQYINTNTGSNANEQRLLHSLVSEAIQFEGIDFTYLPRVMDNEDTLFHESTRSTFSANYTIEGYIETVEAFEGDGDLLSGLGLSITDQTTIHISQKRFFEETNKYLPVEGDLIYFPMAKSVFEIKFVQNEDQFYPLGTLPSFKIQCAKYEYSGETFNTGIAVLDSIDDTIVDAAGDTISTQAQPNSTNIDIQTEADTFVDFSENNPFGKA